nr:hypothetical protein [Candidatus Cloacimonadota bacterium]
MTRWKYLIIALIGLVVIISALTAYELFSWRDTSEHAVKVEPGESAASIGAKLEEAGIIANAKSFKLLTKVRRADRNLKSGTYIFGGHTNLWQTVSRLKEGVSATCRITFPEGLSMYQTLKLIEESGLADFNELYSAATDTALVRRLTGMPLKSLEGFLYPETYFFPVNCSGDSILSIMTREFFHKMQLQGIDPHDIQDFYDRLKLASIVEKEAGNNSERAKIAGVFERRLRLGMPLQSCPTVNYILEQRGVRRAVLTTADTEISSPYNTYQNPGLPPTPISNPSIESILAALNPQEHNYLYFFADGKGGNVFSTSFAEHQRLQRQQKYR